LAVKKVGYHDLDPDVLNDILQKAASGSVAYDDRALKKKLSNLQQQMTELNRNGSENSFNKFLDKVTENMLSEDLLNKINKALKAIDGTDSDQQRLNEEFIEKIDSASQKCSDEAVTRSAKDESHDSKITEIQTTIDAFNDAITAMEAALDAIRNASYDMLIGATETSDGSSGMVPAPLAGEQKCVLTGDAKWTSQNDIEAGRAMNDENGTSITQYIKDITFDEENKKLVLTRGNAETKEIPLAE
jgi:hypothetical protein